MNGSSETLIVSSSTLSSENNDLYELPEDGRYVVDPRKRYEELLEQASLLIEDGILCRDINHKMKTISQINVYRLYNSGLSKAIRNISMTVMMLLAFFETPNSLTLSPDPRKIAKPGEGRPELPYRLTESVEIIALTIIGFMAIVDAWLVGLKSLKRKPWMMFLLLSVIISLIDITIDLSKGRESDNLRLRRLLRPFIFIQSSSMMKKLLKSVAQTVPEMLSVLLLLCFHLYFFAMIGMLVLTEKEVSSNIEPTDLFNDSTYFSRLGDAIVSLLVLLTTANNPDVMMPSYKLNRFASLFFIIFSFVGTFLIMNLLTAVIYNQFRGYLQQTLQHSLNRRQIAYFGSFFKLVESDKVMAEEFSGTYKLDSVRSETIVTCLKLSSGYYPNLDVVLKHSLVTEKDALNLDDYNKLMDILSSNLKNDQYISKVTRYRELVNLQRYILCKTFDHVGNFIAVINVLTLTCEISLYPEHTQQPNTEPVNEALTSLGYINIVIAVYYAVEQSAKLWANGIIYCQRIELLYDGFVAAALIFVLVIEQWVIHYYAYAPEWIWILSRLINILIVMRLLRILPRFRPLALVAGSLVEVLKSLKHCAGILFAAFYLYATIGMIFFKGKIDFTKMSNSTSSTHCGSYAQLDYYSNNFDDFFSSIVLLWDLLVVNNWHVFLYIFRDQINPWTQLYFVSWWLVSAVVILNIFVALILDNFIAKWENVQKVPDNDVKAVFKISMLELHKDILENPPHSFLKEALQKHDFISFPSLIEELGVD